MHWKRWQRHGSPEPTREYHGSTGTAEHSIWKGMKGRCLNPNGQDFGHYGGRGIKVCDRWQRSFQNFLEDVGRRPTIGHTLERIDNNGDYEPGNVVWVTRLVQANNTRQNHILKYNDEELTIAQWARKLDLKHSTLKHRIYRGWTTEQALTGKRG